MVSELLKNQQSNEGSSKNSGSNNNSNCGFSNMFTTACTQKSKSIDNQSDDTRNVNSQRCD